MAPASRRAQGLVLLALLCVLGVAAWYGRMVWADSGSFTVALFGTPAACAAVALAVERTSRTALAPVVVAVLAVVSLAWALLTALGPGVFLVVPSILLLLAAMASWLDRAERRSAPSSQG